MRQCGDCQLCCKLLPVHEPPVEKAAGVRCVHQRHGKGCNIYAKRPHACAIWNCRWLVNDDAADLSRPDRSHYVIDLMPDFVTTIDNETGTRTNIQVVQIWCDPKYPDAHRDPHLRAWMQRRAQQGIACIVRFNSRDAITIFPPPFDPKGEWHEIDSNAASIRQPHTFDEVQRALGPARVIYEE